ncbi:hypothetical protein D3C72_185870 [compost metagenome]
MNSNSDLRYECEEYARQQWGPMVTERDNTIRELRARLHAVEAKESKLKVEAEHGRALAKMVAAINENPASKVYWDKAMAMLRLSE